MTNAQHAQIRPPSSVLRLSSFISSALARLSTGPAVDLLVRHAEQPGHVAAKNPGLRVAVVVAQHGLVHC